MKRILSVFSVLVLSLLLSTCSLFEEQQPDYIDQMIDAATTGDLVAGREAEYLYKQHLNAIGAEEDLISFDELFLMSKFIQSQSGTYRNNETFLLCLGEVVLNRLESREFPNTLAEVIYQPGEFEGVDSADFQCSLIPSKDCVLLALRLFQGAQSKKRFRQKGPSSDVERRAERKLICIIKLLRVKKRRKKTSNSI